MFNAKSYYLRLKTLAKFFLCRYNKKVVFATVAQLVEQLIRNQQVAGSNPASSSIRPACQKAGLFCRFKPSLHIM